MWSEKQTVVEESLSRMLLVLKMEEVGFRKEKNNFLPELIEGTQHC